MIEFVGKTTWQVHPGTIEGAGGMLGQLTHIRLRGIDAYVRESDCRRGNFNVSSGERWGMKVGAGRVPTKNQILELAAPESVWDELAQLVYQGDPLRRQVRRNRRFTLSWAESEFAKII